MGELETTQIGGGATYAPIGTTVAEPAALREVRVPRTDWVRMRRLPWGAPLDDWERLGVTPLSVRKGESRHPVLFVEAGRRRYAIKETSPVAAAREIGVFQELQRRGCRTLAPVGYVVSRGEPLPAGEVAGRTVYLSGDTGYCITRLAERVLPQSILYRYPFTDQNKRLLWNAVAELLLSLHESGCYWGDASLANVLMDLGGARLTAVMADAETAETFAYGLAEGLRRDDLDAFLESLAFQAEDIRLARDLPEDQQLVTEVDADYFLSRYAGLRAEREHTRRAHLPVLSASVFSRVLDIERRIHRLDTLGYGVLNLGSKMLPASGLLVGSRYADELAAAVRGDLDVQVATLRPGWYTRRLRALLGVRIPPAFAKRIYRHLTIHKWLMSERAGHDVGLEEAVHDWQQRYHHAALAFLDTYLPDADPATRYAAYADILDHTWQMSLEQHRAVPLEEGAMDYALQRTRGTVPEK
jgi:hypothetical protein